MSLEGKVAVVTGASRGIGAEIAQQLAAQGASVACLATSANNAQGTVDKIVADGGNAAAYGCSVGEAESVEETFKQINADLGVPYCLVNNAGVTRDQLLIRMSEEDFDQVVQVNLKGAWLCAKAAARPMMKAREGRIINLTSVNGLHGAAGQTNYASSKAGVVGLTKSLAKELGARGITCNAIAPGFIQTDMTKDLDSGMKETVEGQTPIGRLGTPGDIAPAVVFLASLEAGFITGQVLTVDGGLYM
jgi:3-oxoacyl-[acyl-carrier protein] reductase